MRLGIDIGNTAAKWALFEGRTLLRHGAVCRPDEAVCRSETDTTLPAAGLGEGLEPLPAIEQALVCASGDMAAWEGWLAGFNFKYSILNSETPLPIQLDYKTPKTLGADRVAAACGAWGLHPGEASLIVDAGTCITVDYLDAEGVYHGGAIMPGLKMSLRALNSFTAKLPLVDIDGVEKATVIGRSTEESIVAGTLGATMLALAGFVALYKEKNPALHVLLTGGDAERLTKAGATGWELTPQLTLRGINEIMVKSEK